ncbi:MAG TPA: SDR family oxidoreductase [Anaerolineae bacterium]
MAALDGKVVVITGSSRGFGLEAARACAGAGASVVVSARSTENVNQALAVLRAGGATAEGWPCDVAELSQVESLAARTIDRFGHFDVWINNAGVSGTFGPTAHLEPQDFLRVIDTNIVGTYHGSLVALRHFYPQRGGKLINILGRGDTGPVPLQNAYTASKIWVRSFTKALAAEYRGDGIGIFAFNPGLMLTDLMTDLRAVAGYEDRLNALKTVLRLWGKPPAVPAQKLVWLASVATDGKTGLMLRVLTPKQMAAGVLREGVRRLTGRPAAEIDLHIESVSPALSPRAYPPRTVAEASNGGTRLGAGQV